MDVRLIAGSLLLLAAAAFAQEQKPQGKPGAQPVQPAPTQTPAPAPAADPKAQDPDKPQPTPAEVAQQLTKERDRLSHEIAYAKDRAKNAKAELAAKMKPHAETYKAIDAGVVAVPAPPAMAQPAQPRSARLGEPNEFASLDADTMMLVNGRNVSRRAYDQLIDFRKATATPGEAPHIAGATLFELIQIEGVASAMDDNEALERVAEIEAKLDAGTPIADLVKDVGVLPGAGPDGRFETTRNSMFGSAFASRAFSTVAGKRVRPFRNAHGFVVMQIDKVTKGEKPELDTVSGVALQVPYSGDPALLQKAQTAVHTAQIDIVVKDKDILELMPPMFRRDASPRMMPAPGFDLTRLQAELERLGKELQALEGKDDDASKAKRQAIEMQYQTMKRQLRAAEAGTDPAQQGSDAAKDQQKADQPKADQPKTDQPKTDQPKTGQPKADQPK